MSKQSKVIFWVVLAILIFSFFRWLFGIALPEIALEFATGTTIVLVSGLFSGRVTSLYALRVNPSIPWSSVVVVLYLVIFFGVIAIAFLLNAMIENTTLFPFSMTVLLLFLVMAAVASVVTILRHQHHTKVTAAQVAMAQSRNELQLLQAQLSPHFLFNTLNNLYGLSLNDPDKVPPLLLRLSSLLRYSVYDVKDVFVPLQYEVDYLENYIAFEKIRLGERLDLNVQLDVSASLDFKIPPLLLVVFVENAFKHSRNTANEKIKIDISLHQLQDSIVFFVKNSCTHETTRSEMHGRHSGFGLASVRKRLDLLYRGKHQLNVDHTTNEFEIRLTLQSA